MIEMRLTPEPIANEALREFKDLLRRLLNDPSRIPPPPRPEARAPR